jgi:hypothetical protein
MAVDVMQPLSTLSADELRSKASDYTAIAATARARVIAEALLRLAQRLAEMAQEKTGLEAR